MEFPLKVWNFHCKSGNSIEWVEFYFCPSTTRTTSEAFLRPLRSTDSRSKTSYPWLSSKLRFETFKVAPNQTFSSDSMIPELWIIKIGPWRAELQNDQKCRSYPIWLFSRVLHISALRGPSLRNQSSTNYMSWIKWESFFMIVGSNSTFSTISLRILAFFEKITAVQELIHGVTTEGATVALIPRCPWNKSFFLSADRLTLSACCSCAPWASQSAGPPQPPALFWSPSVLPRAMLKGWREGLFPGSSWPMSVNQDHTSQDHFCSVINGFPVWNSKSIKPRGWDLVSSPEREAGWGFTRIPSLRWSLTAPFQAQWWRRGSLSGMYSISKVKSVSVCR